MWISCLVYVWFVFCPVIVTMNKWYLPGGCCWSPSSEHTEILIEVWTSFSLSGKSLLTHQYFSFCYLLITILFHFIFYGNCIVWSQLLSVGRHLRALLFLLFTHNISVIFQIIHYVCLNHDRKCLIASPSFSELADDWVFFWLHRLFWVFNKSLTLCSNTGIQFTEGLFSNNGDETKPPMFKFSMSWTTGYMNHVPLLYEWYFTCLKLCLICLDPWYMQKEYAQTKPARDALAKAKMEAEASVSKEGPLHMDNEWNIRYYLASYEY